MLNFIQNLDCRAAQQCALRHATLYSCFISKQRQMFTLHEATKTFL